MSIVFLYKVNIRAHIIDHYPFQESDIIHIIHPPEIDFIEYLDHKDSRKCIVRRAVKIHELFIFPRILLSVTRVYSFICCLEYAVMVKRFRSSGDDG